jgi:hypothetical protein
MLICIIIKNDNISENKIKNVCEENIYKKCGYKNNDNFNKKFEWEYLDNFIIELWGKNETKSENNFTIFKKYDIKIGSKSIFLLKNKNNNIYYSLKYDDFINFFKLNSKKDDNTSEEDEEDSAEDINITKNSLDSKEDENLDYESDNSELSYDVYYYSDERE